MFEKVIDDAAESTGWNTDAKYSLLLDFLEQHCPEKLELFKTVIGQIEVDELEVSD